YAGKRFPSDSSVLGTKKALRRRAGIPRVRFVRVARREPECVIHHTALFTLSRLSKGRGAGGLFPGFAKIGGAKDCRSEVTGFCCSQKSSSVARIHDEMIDDVTQEVRSVGLPVLPLCIAVKQPRALSRGDQDDDLA